MSFDSRQAACSASECTPAAYRYRYRRHLLLVPNMARQHNDPKLLLAVLHLLCCGAHT
jgi:hypothetical protein